MRHLRGFPLLPIAVLLCCGACSLTKTIEPGEYLYTGSSLEIEAPDSVSTKALYNKLEGLLAPRTNRKILGIPYRLAAYNLFASKKEKGLGPWLQRTLGEEPILFDPDYLPRVSGVLASRSFNEGYFWNDVRVEVDSANKKAAVQYIVEVEAPYRIGSYELNIRDSLVRRKIEEVSDASVLEIGATYQLEDLRQERQRIEQHLREEGFFYFDRDHLLFYGDSTREDRQVFLTLSLKDDVPSTALRPSYISSIHLYPSYQQAGVAPRAIGLADSIYIHGEGLDVRLNPVLRAIIPRPGDRYNASFHQRTQERLMNLPYFQFANVRFRNESARDSMLRMDVFLSPALQHTIQGAAGIAHKSTHFLGPEFNVTYLNRNFFGGSELLRVSANANFNFPLRRSLGQYYEEIEGSVGLTRPGLLVPFLNDRSRKRVRSSGTTFQFTMKRQRASVRLVPDTLDASLYATIIRELGFTNLADNIDQDSTYAPFVAVNEPEFRFGYQWSVKKTINQYFNPIRLRLQYTTYEEDELQFFFSFFGSLAQNLDLVISLQRMFIYQPEYIFIYDGRLDGVERHNFFYRGRLSFAGNSVLPSSIPEFDERSLESRFLQTENDFRYFFHLPRDHVLAFRLITNFSFPLGDELILPFFDFYSVGGPNSVRAFGTREVGPGTRPPERAGISEIARGRGDIKIESSVEYRHRLTSMFELGFFVDAGNVWFFNERPELEEKVNFEFSDFYRQLAIGTGVGLRVLLSGLVIRLDFAVPLSKPWFPEGERWLPDGIKFGDPSWRRDNLVWNLAFGYPF